jgi:hypothetical protein
MMFRSYINRHENAIKSLSSSEKRIQTSGIAKINEKGVK